MGVEALTRFHHAPERPDHWFADANRVGLGTELELATAAAALNRIDRLPNEVFLSLNLSPDTLTDGRLERLLIPLAQRVVIEITEHTPVRDYGALLSVLQRFRNWGVRLAVDDVGAGFSSMRHVLELDPHLVKIDRSIIRHVQQDLARQTLVSAVCTLADQRGWCVVAEGVETAAELSQLAASGVELVQGYLFERPRLVPLKTLEYPLAARAGTTEGAAERTPSTTELLELAMHHSPIPVCFVGLDGRFLHVNPALAALLGYAPAELCEMTFQELTHPEDLGADLELLQACLDGHRTSYRMEKRYLRRDGSAVWGDLSVVLVRSGSGAPRFFVSQIVDVTDRRGGTSTTPTNRPANATECQRHRGSQPVSPPGSTDPPGPDRRAMWGGVLSDPRASRTEPRRRARRR
jgi:PAS domain S-box-containing protein